MAGVSPPQIARQDPLGLRGVNFWVPIFDASFHGQARVRPPQSPRVNRVYNLHARLGARSRARNMRDHLRDQTAENREPLGKPNVAQVSPTVLRDTQPDARDF
jgi:hypothetical protein